MEDCQLVTDMGHQHLRSAVVHICAVPCRQTRLGNRSFTVARPWLWNNLPVELWQRDICLSEFRRLLKTFLSCRASAPCDFLFKCTTYKYTSTLTFLLTYSRQEAWMALHCALLALAISYHSGSDIAKDCYSERPLHEHSMNTEHTSTTIITQQK